MTTVLPAIMASYAAYHQDHRNKLTHFVGVPLIVLSVFIALAYARFTAFGLPLSAAVVFYAVMIMVYLALDVTFGLTLAAVTLPMVWGAGEISLMAPVQGLGWALGLFVVGWAFQLLGHKFEGNKPALVDNLLQIFMAPLFLAAEAFFAAGLKPALAAEVARRVDRRHTVAVKV